MLGLVTLKETIDVVDYGNDRDEENLFSGVTRRFFETYCARPGFFTRYNSGNEFLGGVIAPVVYPLELAGFALVAGLVMAIAPVVCIGSLIVAGTASLFGYTDVANEATNVAITSLFLTGMSILVTAASLLLAAVSPFHAVASLLTRSLATVGGAAYDCIAGPRTKPKEAGEYELESHQEEEDYNQLQVITI